jgi:hypothetical protein
MKDMTMGNANLGSNWTEQHQQEHTTTIPNLAGVATADLVEHIGAGSYKASYINWSRTMHLLRTNAPGWMPEVVHAPDGGLLWQAPVGCFMMFRFRNGNTCTPSVPQAVMDQRNAAVPIERITARDITDTHRRGVCMAAAFTFGLSYELWAKMPLESGHVEAVDPVHVDPPKPEPMTQAAIADCLAAIDSASADEIEGVMKGAYAAAEKVKDRDAYAAFRAQKNKRVKAAA